MNKAIQVLIFLILLSKFCFAQDQISDQEYNLQNGRWIKYKSTQNISSEEVINRLHSKKNLAQNAEFRSVIEIIDDRGMKHTSLQQYVDDIPIEGARYFLHSSKNIIVSSNGQLVEGKMKNNEPRLDKNLAIEKAIKELNAPGYLWQKPGMEALVKRIKDDPTASFYPVPELVYADKNYSNNAQDYSLCWKMDIYADEPIGTKEVFVDAIDGTILFMNELCNTHSVPATAETRYHGTQQMTTDSITPDSFILRDYTRGGGIETFDMQEQQDVSLAVDFVDKDNYWDNANEDFNDAATDVHWGMGATYDYFNNEQGRDSYDGQGSKIISYVHYGRRWFNASWNGMFARFGDGNNNPLTSIDVVSHELTHGFTRTSSNLVYRNESGALNESFSDIFGTVVEIYATGDSADWLIGKENFTLRSMSNPKEYGDPDTYRGENWFDGPEDNGGVHTNSGVMNYWYYLLAEGGSGVNDNGNSYDIQGIGWDKAADIAYRNNAYYLTDNSNYIDARIGSLLSAEDIFGSCSPEVLAAAQAWYAVGVGPEMVNKNLIISEIISPVSGCSDGQELEVIIAYKLNRSGCGFEVQEGEVLNFGYRFRNGDEVVEEYEIAELFSEEETSEYTFNLPADLIQPGEYRMDFWVSFKDGTGFGDTLFNEIITVPEVISQERLITFEPFGSSADSFYVQSNELAEVIFVQSLNAPQGFQYASLTGSEFNLDQPFEIALTSAELFSQNPEYNSRLCMCVDLTGWQNPVLEFDLQQTWSSIYRILGFSSSDRVNGMRVMINEQQLGPVYHPRDHTESEDNWNTERLSLQNYVNQQFELCFEGKHFFSKEEDPMEDSEGDQSNIDKVRIFESEITSLEDILQDQINIFPNPASTYLIIQTPEFLMDRPLEISIYNALGYVVLSETHNSSTSEIRLDLQTSPGIFWLEIKTGEKVIQKMIEIID